MSSIFFVQKYNTIHPITVNPRIGHPRISPPRLCPHPDPEIRLSPSLNIFKTKLSKLIRPTPKLVYGIHDPKGLAILTQLLVGLSKLNYHKYRHNFRDTFNPLCPANDGVEDTEHFLLLLLLLSRSDLLSSVNAILVFHLFQMKL